MNSKIQILKERAEIARILYNQNKITRGEAHAEIIPYILEVNKASERIAKKYNQHPKKIDFSSFIR